MFHNGDDDGNGKVGVCDGWLSLYSKYEDDDDAWRHPKTNNAVITFYP